MLRYKDFLNRGVTVLLHSWVEAHAVLRSTLLLRQHIFELFLTQLIIMSNKYSMNVSQKWPFFEPTQSFCWRIIGMFPKRLCR